VDLELVLNELSLQTPADNVQMAKQCMSEFINTALEANDHGVNYVLRIHESFYEDILAPNYLISDWLVDQTVDREKQRYILSFSKLPFLADVQPELIEKNLLSEFRFQEQLAQGFGIAYLLESLAISLNSSSQWNTTHIDLEAMWIDEDETEITESVTIIHASSPKHISQHIPWIQNRLKTGVRDGFDLWKRRTDLFPSLSFCEITKQQIQSLKAGDPILRQVVKRLFELESSCKQWKSGNFNWDSLPSKATPESESRRQRLKSKLTIQCPDGKERLFSLHLRMTPGGWRLYFSTDNLPPGNIIIGYIGSKIE
jgi:hypothetical protein